MSFDYRLWPNPDGNLGQKKVAIPDGITVEWPDGDALVGKFVYKDGKLVGFVDNKALTVNDSKSTTFPYDYVNIELDKSLEGKLTINKGERTKYLTVTYFVDNRPEEIIVTIRFEDMDEETKTFLRSATKIIDNTLYDAEDNVIGTFDTRTLATGSNTVNGDELETTDGKDPDGLWFNIDLIDFGSKNYPLTTFDSNLSNITNGSCMFVGSQITSFNSDLSNLVNGSFMFGLSNLASFSADLSNLVNGKDMFYYSQLITFNSNLCSLEDGREMFYGCTLDEESLQNISLTIKDVTNVEGEHILGLGNISFELDYEDIISTIERKGWTVSFEKSWPQFFYNTVKIINNNFYDANDNLIGTYDTSSITSSTTLRGTYDSILIFDSDLSSLIDGEAMFNASTITSFRGDLNLLENGTSMFGASDLTSFDSSLPSLNDGESMFNGCELDEASLLRIASTIKKHEGHDHKIEIGGFMTNVYETYPKWNEIRNNLISKGWVVYGFGFPSFGGWDLEQQLIIDETSKIENNICYDSNGSKIGTIDTSIIENGVQKFGHHKKIQTFNSDLSSLINGDEMFEQAHKIETFKSNLSALEDGDHMFFYCYNLTEFDADLSSLIKAHWMFKDCHDLKTFKSKLSSLKDGHYMFDSCYGITNCSIDLSSLEKGFCMFGDCKNLVIFSSNLDSLTYAPNMFVNCSNLQVFTSSLHNLETAYYMFKGCKLNTQSVQNIANTIKNVSDIPILSSLDNRIDIGIANSTPNTEEKEAFNTMVSKGWVVYVNGSSSAYTPATAMLDENGEEQTITPIPYYAKPVEVSEDKAKYISEDGKFYCIVGAQFIYGDDISTYGMFTCEEEAAANMRLTKYEKPAESTNKTNVQTNSKSVLSMEEKKEKLMELFRRNKS